MINGKVKTVWACKQPKCNECSCHTEIDAGTVESDAIDPERHIDVTSIPEDVISTIGLQPTRKSNRRRKRTVTALEKDYILDGIGIDNAMRGKIAVSHALLGSSGANVDDVVSAFGSPAVKRAVSHVSKKQKTMLANGEPCDVKEELFSVEEGDECLHG